MDNQGFIKIYRKMLDWEWYKNENAKNVFIHCLLKANWKDGRFQGYDVPRGSFVTGRRQLSQELNISEQSIRTALKRLKSTNEITIKTTKNFSIITIVNYEKYQETNQEINQHLTNNQPTANQHLTTIEEYKEIKNKRSVCVENTQSLAPSLSDIIAYGNSLGADSNYCERFYNHYESIGWVNANGIKIKNWKLTLNNWYKKDLESGKIKKVDTSRRLG